MGLAVSDLLLAVAGLWTIWHLRSAQPLPARLFGLLGVGLLSVAAVLGAIHYADHPELAGLHLQASNLGAVLGLPLMMLALVCLRLTWSGQARLWLIAGLLAVVCGVALAGDRLFAAGVSLGLLLVGAALQPRQFFAPLVIGLWLLLMGMWRQFEAVDISLRLIVIHLALVGLLAFWLREMGRAAPRWVEDTQQ